VSWELLTVSETPNTVSAIAKRLEKWGQAVASAELVVINPAEYGVPESVPWSQVYRFSRVKAQPPGRGGGRVVLDAALAALDARGAWAVLEASPYDGRSHEALMAFYRRHGFEDGPEPGLMFRPPGDTREQA
jgi:GNAT superfamily N-acetyltransferase